MMKHLIYFLLFSTAAFSQNYNYGIDEVPKNTTPARPAPIVVNNQLEEIEYFKAYLLPITQKATIQQALDKYGSVRLEKGDYSGVNIVMKSNQRLYGHPSLTQVSNIIISSGSSNIVLQDLFMPDKTITIQSGGVISGCTFKTIKWGVIQGTNILFENNLLINVGCPIRFDCSQSGYFRNNKIIKHRSGTVYPLLVMKGNSITPSYGNVHLWTNFLTPHGDATELNALQSSTFVGLDAEGWNMKGEGTNAMFKASNMGDVRITDFGGGNGFSQVKTGAFDIDADKLLFINKILRIPELDKISSKTNITTIFGEGTYTRTIGTPIGIDIQAHINNNEAIKSVFYNGFWQNSTIFNQLDIDRIKKSILSNQYNPWSRPNWEMLPDPTGVNWRSERIGKTDSRAYIQNLIDTNNIADLPEGIFYIGSTLILDLTKRGGIVGKGTGKTVIVCLTDDFPLITLKGGQDDNFTLANLTLQGGSKGIYSSQNYGTQHMAFVWMKYVVFRDQIYGIHLDKIVGFDNNFLDNVSFVNCSKGFYQEPEIPQVNFDSTCFVDKTVFYKSQFINCGVGVSMRATRADNLNAWIDCKFDGGQTAIESSGNNFPIFANCDFTKINGDYIIDGDHSFYNCKFYNNNPLKSQFMSKQTILEGCDLEDNVKLFPDEIHHGANYYIINSKIKGNVFRTYGVTQSLFMNSSLSSNPTLSKLLVNVKDNIPTVLINDAPKPYPQLLVTQ